ncbi:MAG: hypothetical protein DRI77_09115 [Chloroflexi bacterium]|nr:MAG: hypothetical protein DRI77_09115 [Chloroflexota bacterium]
MEAGGLGASSMRGSLGADAVSRVQSGYAAYVSPADRHRATSVAHGDTQPHGYGGTGNRNSSAIAHPNPDEHHPT